MMTADGEVDRTRVQIIVQLPRKQKVPQLSASCLGFIGEFGNFPTLVHFIAWLVVETKFQ